MENLEPLLKLLSVEERAIVEKSMTTFPDVTEKQIWKDHVFLSGCRAKTAEICYEEWNPREGDIFIVTYPKTGTVWTTAVINKLLASNEVHGKMYESLPPSLVCLEFGSAEKFSIIDKLPLQRRLFFTHLPAALLNLDKIKKANAKVVMILRNPKDQIVSFYNFLQKIPTGKVEPLKSMIGSGWNTFFEHAISGDLPDFMKPGDWYPDYMLSWNEHAEDKNFYLMYFEEMKKDLPKQVKNLANFLGILVTEERIQKVAEECMFNQMKQNATAEKSLRSNLSQTILRKGGVGGWKDYFTVSQSERIDAIMEEKLKDTDIKLTYSL